ncbi:MAG: DUF503 domain-containing protein [Firmicutes bacterium]|nr:DUF503 domain-containing protein [Ezakiella sp.]MDD7761910.1 DUF503 domain-containing protein [Bacillota bacterium]
MKIIAMDLLIRLFEIHSIKDKRSIRESIIRKLKNKFNISIAEVSNQDDLHFLGLGIVIVSNDYKFLDEISNKLINFIETNFDLDIISNEVSYL